MLKETIISLISILFISHIAHAQTNWLQVGPAGFSTSEINDLSFALDPDGNPWIAYQDNGVGATVMKYNGSNWVVVGKPSFTPWVATHISLGIDKNGTPYVVFKDANNYGRVNVMKYDGNNWVTVGSNTVATYVQPITSSSIDIDSFGTPYIACADYDIISSRLLWVKKFDGTHWVKVGGYALYHNYNHNAKIRIGNDAVPYVAFWTYQVQGNSMTVMKYSGATWNTIGNSSFAAGSASMDFFDVDNRGLPYVAYRSTTSGVKKHNNKSWNDFNNAAIAGLSVDDELSLAISNTNIPYLAFKDTNYKAIVMKYVGNDWINVGNAGFSNGSISKISLAIDKTGVPYVAYIDSSNGNRATVMKLDCPQQPRASICAAFTDSASKMNKLVWDNNSAVFVDSYKIYRQDVLNHYKYLGSVSAGSNSFTDTGVNPALQSYTYKLISVDSCSREWNIDSASTHKTVCLKFSYLGGTVPSLSWNSYEGISNPLYTLTRSINGGVYMPIARFGITGHDTTFLYFYNPPDDTKYRVEISLPGSCNIGGNSYNIVTSNIVSTWKTGIDKKRSYSSIIIMPNPADKEIKITAGENIDHLDIFSISGIKLISLNAKGKEVIADISNLPPAMYILRVNHTDNMRFIKR